ncbi:CBS-domain-containing protein [Rozella allomycis CSF55]|uniref:CBS-domain-containing protein n=1 Tax=Rozella allomycis (strain CSF55) TaxID=988480 RepID=A0A4P9YKV3_ROZAC|nr:CBS-domain-containing protein [Rozella allomycis CSF55]
MSKRQPSVDEVVLHTTNYLKAITCYDILPVNSKLIFLDTSLLVKKALYALLQNGVRAAPLWDQGKRAIVGILTATDFLQLILYFYDNATEFDQVRDQMNNLTIKQIRDQKIIPVGPEIFRVYPTNSVFDAANSIINYKVHRLLLMDPTALENTVISFMTPYRIINFLSVNFPHLPFFKRTIEELGIGTFHNVAKLTASTPIIEAVRMFVNRHVSALPVVDEDGILIDVYEKYDLMVLAKGDQITNYDQPLQEALLSRSEIFEGIHTCRKTDTLESILLLLRRVTAHRFIVVGERNKLEGVLSLSDILKFFVDVKFN